MQVVLVYLEWFRRNSVLKCVLQPKIAKNSVKTPIFGVQGRSESSMLVPLESSSAVLVMIGGKSVSICNRFHARWANSGKITSLRRPRSRGISSPSGTKLPRKKLETRLSYGEDPESLSHLAWIHTGSWQTDRQTDRIPVANTRSQQYPPVQLSRVKTYSEDRCALSKTVFTCKIKHFLYVLDVVACKTLHWASCIS